MATTTNYSWTTPDDTDLVKDGAAAIRTLGSAIDTTVFNNAGAAVAKSTIDAKGDLLVGTADNTVGRLAVGTNGYTLVADSAETTGLKWAAPAGGGKVLQVVQGTTTTDTAINTTTFTDTTLTASITPSANTSKVLIIASQQVYMQRTGTSKSAGIQLLRDATNIFDDDTWYSASIAAVTVSDVGHTNRIPIIYLDSPSTSSAITYKVQMRSNTANGSMNAQFGNADSTIILNEVGA